MSTSSVCAASALTGVTAAAFVIPAAWPLVAEMFEDQCDPEGILAAGMRWFDIAGELDEADTAAKEVVHGLTQEEWKGEDRDAFDHKIDDYGWQITCAKFTALAVGAALICLAIMLFLLVAVMVIIAVIMLCYMGYVLATMAGVVTAVATPAAEAAASQAAVSCFNALDRLDTTEEKIAIALAATIGAVTAADIGGQMFKGDDSALRDLGKGFVDGIDNILWGSLSRLERDLNKAMMNGAKWPLSKFGFNAPKIPRSAGTWGGTTTWGGATGLTQGNISDNLHGLIGDGNDGELRG